MILALLALACAGPAPSPGAADTGPPLPPLEPQVGLVEGGEQVCADPDARATLGPMETLDLGPAWAAQWPDTLPNSDRPQPSAGVVIDDLTGDGRLDVFLPAFTPCQLYVGLPDGTLANESLARLPNAAADCEAWGASAVDADADGDLDLFVARNGAPDRLWFNDGAGRFAPSAASIGLTPHLCGSRSGTWGDPDGDGDLDLFVARHHPVRGADTADCERGEPLPGREIRPGDANALYLNAGDGTFTDVTARLGDAGTYGYSFVGAWLDLDEDGHQDLYVINDYGTRAESNLLLLGDGGGGLTRADPSTGLDLRADAMGVAVADVNDDGHPDLAVSDLWALHLLMSDGDGAWYDAARSVGLAPDPDLSQNAAWAVEWVDLDHDLDLDLLASYGPTEQLIAAGRAEARQPDALFIQQSDGRFEDHAPEWGLDQKTVGRALLALDFDRDGWLDVVKTDYRGGPVEILRSRCGAEAWVTVRLDAAPRAVHAVGARVEVHLPDRTLTRWMPAPGSQLASSAPPELHFGLGDHDRVDGMTVTWPDGRVDRFGPIGTRQHLTVVRAALE